MARKPRIFLPEVPQHLVQRGNNREPCFFSEEDYRCYLEFLAETAKKYGCRIHAYVLMTNHVHMLVTPEDEYSVSNMMQSLGRKYVRYINHVYKRSGTLWEGRFKSGLVQSENYLLMCSRYIELNPVRAQMVGMPDEYKWSSYHHNAWGKEDGVVNQHEIYGSLGHSAEQREYAYRELFRHHMDNDMLHEIRHALNHESILGSSYFMEKVERILDRRLEPGKPGRPRVEEVGELYEVY
jgi:putative transposase